MYEAINSVVYLLQICPKEIIRKTHEECSGGVMRAVIGSHQNTQQLGIYLLSKWMLPLDGLLGGHVNHFGFEYSKMWVKIERVTPVLHNRNEFTCIKLYR